MKVLPARDARPDDAETLVAMIRELAVFEKLEHLVRITPDDLRAQLFGPRPAAYAVVVEAEANTGLPPGRSQGRPAAPGGTAAAREAIAFALYFHNFSTFLGKPGLYLEDLYVRPAWRGQGIGKGLLVHLARIAVGRGCGRFEWSVLDWNTRAIDVYRGIGAQLLDDWRICRVTGEALERLGAAA
jgi:GNAT superfamily N-acetyltransferase